MKNRIFAIGLLVFGWVVAGAAQPTRLGLKPGDHVVLIGGALPDRMQHSGQFETLVHARHPGHQLVFRNLAAAGDEVVARHRSENFGTPDDWLTRTRADVILAFFGFNESFKGAAGVAAFKSDLETFLKQTATKNYSGKGAPTVVLVSPIANERHVDPNYPDPAVNNANVALYAKAMREVADAAGVLYVDLLEPSHAMYAAAAKRGRSLTVNGVYLTDEGEEQLAPALFQGLFGEAPPKGDFRKLRSAVNDKNAQWHARYRTIDGYNVYGGRSALAYQPGKGGFISDRTPPEPYISNYKVMQEEMAQRDVMTANRDQRVWAVAKGGDLVVDDTNLPSVTKVKTNKPGSAPDESHVYLGGEEAIAKMTVHSGMKVNLFASEEQFPELVNPVQMAWDTRGRLWVAAWPNYPGRSPDSKVGDSLLMFEDRNGDGKADKMTRFVGDLNAPTGFQFYKDGVLVMQAPDLWFVRDTDGDGKGDWKERVLMGMDSADSHHTANAICLDPGGAIYLSDGVFHRTQVETARGPVRNNDAAIYRFEPRTGAFETYIPYGFANPHGRVFDYWGNDIVTDATGNANYFGPAFSGYLDYPAKHPGMREFWNRPSRPCPGTGILTSRHFPAEFQGNFLNLNVISFQGIFRVKVTEEGSGLKGETLENIVSSSDPNFRPSAVSMGPDGAIYFCDWHQAIIGHMQHHLRDPNRGKRYGRVYRITYNGRELAKPVRIQGRPIPALLDLLKEPENQTRELAKVELGARDTAKVVAAVKTWAAGLDPKDPAYEHHMMEALWVHQWHNVVNVDLLMRMLGSKEHNARAAAARVLCYWRDRVPDALGLFKKLAGDESPRVRLEAVRAASFFRTGEAVDVALEIVKKPTDYYLDYTLKESVRQLEKYWRKAIADGRPVAEGNPAGLNYLVASLSTTELMQMPRATGVLEAILTRPGVSDADRNLALNDLATQRKMTAARQLLELLETRGSADAGVAAGLARLLPVQVPDDLKPLRARVEALATGGTAPMVRQAGWATLAVTDDSFAGAWGMAAKSAGSLAELMDGIPLLADAGFRSKAYDQVQPLLASVPERYTTGAGGVGKAGGRYVRIELPRRGTLTLAEVQVMSDGRNVALKGTARQSSTANGGGPAKAIDGGTDGAFAGGSQTHTREDESNPWWEVDLGAEYPVDSVVVWNRTESGLGRRLDGYTLSVLDAGRREVFRKVGNAAPAESATVAVSSDPVGLLRRSAIRASVSMNENQAKTFASLVELIGKGEEVTTAAQGLRVLPRNQWPKEKAGEAAKGLIRWAKNVPENARTGQDFVEIVQFASDLAGFLPSTEAASALSELKGLRVAVFVLRTVREQMRFDAPRLVVEAGKPFELIVENADFMPHNLVVVRPGTRDKVGTAAATMKPEQLDNRGRAYVPRSDDILGATKLLEAGQREALKLTAPAEEGDYEYVCTFPGHHQVMWGWLIVRKDPEGYLRANPTVSVPTAAHDHH